MSKQDNLTDFLTDVADAIREKKGTSEKINPQDFSEEIRSIEGGSPFAVDFGEEIRSIEGGSPFAVDFGEEIRSIEGGSPFAVDFGEEIATGNPAFIGALQEDIDFYNEVQRRRAAGEVTDAALVQEQEFRDRIVWWPKGMNGGYKSNYMRIPYKKLRRYVFPESRLDYYAFKNCPNIEDIEFTASTNRLTDCFNNNSNLKNVTIHGEIVEANSMFNNCLSLESVKIDASKITNALYMFYSNQCLLDVDLSFNSLTSAMSFFMQCRCRNLRIDLPNVKSLSSTFRECEVTDTLYLNIPKVITSSNSLFYNNSSYYALGENVFISGLMVSMSLAFVGASNISVESVKYILDHCQARDDGTSYTLTLRANVLTRFMAKCTEGSEEYDAEYAATLASANEKGLTLA